MYSPTARLLTVLELLQSHKHISGPQLAQRLEIDVRTVRRYIVTLQDMGIPVEAERGPYGAYQLQRGYKLPPLMFTDSEAVALSLGLLMIRELEFPVEIAAVEGALAKIERVLPETLLTQVRGLQETIVFNTNPAPTQFHSHFLTTLSTAAQQRNSVHLRYQSWDGSGSERDFDPYGIVFNEGFWYTAGHCHLRDDVRTFRLDRIVGIESGSQSFERPADFDAMAYVMKSIDSVSGDRQIEVLMYTTLEQAQRFLSPLMGSFEVCDEGVIFRRSESQLEWVAYMLMSADFPIVIKQTPELKRRLRQLAARARELSGEDE